MSVILERPWKQSNNIATLPNILGTFALVLPSEAKYKLLKELSPISSETNKYLSFDLRIILSSDWLVPEVTPIIKEYLP